VHQLVPNTLLDFTYGFITVNLSEFIWYPITSEEFWFDVGAERVDKGESIWDALNTLWAKPRDFNISYFAENTRARGNVIWHHGIYPSKLLHQTYNEGYLIYDNGKVRLWKLTE
jgi:hypothetical protein